MSTQVRGQEVTTEGGKASPNPLLPVIDRAYRSLQVALEELLSPASWALAPVPKRKQEPEHPWLRHPDETAKAYAAFRFYRDLGEQRAGVSVQIKFSLSARLIARWSKTHAWVLRTRLWDEHQDRITIAVNTDAIQTMRLEQADCGRTIQAAALETLEARMTSWRERGSRGEPPFSPFEAARLLRVGSVLEQTARGLGPEGRPGEIGGGSVGEALQDWATRIEAILSEPPVLTSRFPEARPLSGDVVGLGAGRVFSAGRDTGRRPARSPSDRGRAGSPPPLSRSGSSEGQTPINSGLIRHFRNFAGAIDAANTTKGVFVTTAGSRGPRRTMWPRVRSASS